MEIDSKFLSKIGNTTTYKYKYYKIYIKGNAPSKEEKYYIQCKMTLIDNENIEEEMQNIYLDDWKIDSLEIDIADLKEKQKGEINFLRDIAVTTTVKNILEKINTNGIVEIYEKNIKVVDTNTVMKSGMKVVISLNEQEKEYIVIVTEDVNGDGKVSVLDYVKIKNHIMEKIKMRKIVISISIIVLSIVMSMFNNVYAVGSITTSTKSLSITKGNTSSFGITATNACGRVDISSSNSSVASVSISSQWLENNSITVTVTGVSAGTATITVRLSDAATFDEEELLGSYTINVTVTEPQQDTSSSTENNNVDNNSNNSTNNTNNNSNTNSNNSTNNTNNNKNKENDNLSKNNNLTKLSVDGYELKNTEKNTYELEVMNNVSKINITAIAEDKKATILGNGEKNLEIGLNTFEIIVKAESGNTKTYIVKVTRKDAFYLEDFKKILTDNSITNIEMIINKDTIITEEKLKQIKDNRKAVTLKYKDDENNIYYLWEIDGNEIDDINEFKTGISFSSEKTSKIETISNYANGMIINFEHSGNLPKGTKIKIFIGDRYKDGDNVNLYFYNENNEDMELVKKDLLVEEGFIELEINHCSEYFITKSIIEKADVYINKEINIYKVLFVITIIILLIVLMLDIFKINPILKIKKRI